MVKNSLIQFTGEIYEEQTELSLAQLCRCCQITGEQVIELVEYGIVEPIGRQPSDWRFTGRSAQRIRRVLRLQRDLGVNTAGVALALDLLDEINHLHQRIHRLKF